MRPIRHAFAVLPLLAAFASGQGLPAGFVYEAVVTTGLHDACAMAFAPDGRLFLCERFTGQVRILRDGVLEPQPWFTISYPQQPGNESGLLGIAIDPQFLTNGYVYLFYTDPNGLENRIARVRDVGNIGTQFTVLTPGGVLPTHPIQIHNGGRMTFDHQGKLLVSTGDAENLLNSQDPQSWAGKILRFDVPNLTVPTNNPLSGNPVYALGLRNTFGITVHPSRGWLFGADNGYLVGDEINHIVSGGNYGWPIYEGPSSAPGFQSPLLTFTQQPVLVGLSFYEGSMYPTFQGDLFQCQWLDGEVRRLTLDATGSTITSNTLFADHAHSMDLQLGPDGNLWVLLGQMFGGADEVGRYVHTAAPSPGLQISAVSGPSLGGSVTLGVTANVGDFIVPWVGLSAFQPAVPTVFGAVSASPDVLLSALIVGADKRAYYAFELPNSPTFVGVPLYAQALRIAPATMTFDMTNLSTHYLR